MFPMLIIHRSWGSLLGGEGEEEEEGVGGGGGGGYDAVSELDGLMREHVDVTVCGVAIQRCGQRLTPLAFVFCAKKRASEGERERERERERGGGSGEREGGSEREREREKQRE